MVFVLPCPIDYHELSWGLFETMVEQYIERTTPPGDYPGDEEVTNLLCLICIEQEIPLRFYQENEEIEIQVLDTTADMDWALLFDHFTTEYHNLIPLQDGSEDVRESFYQVVEDSLQ